MRSRFAIVASAVLIGVLSPLATAQVGVSKKIAPRTETRLTEQSAVPDRKAGSIRPPAPGQRSFLKGGVSIGRKGSLLGRQSPPRPEATILARTHASRAETLLDRKSKARGSAGILDRKSKPRPEANILDRKPPARAGSTLLKREAPQRPTKTLLTRESPERTDSLIPKGPPRPTPSAEKPFIPPSQLTISRDVYRLVGKGEVRPEDAADLIKERWEQELDRRAAERARLGLSTSRGPRPHRTAPPFR